MVTSFDTIHERDGRTHTHTDRQTPHNGIGRAYAQHRAAMNDRQRNRRR